MLLRRTPARGGFHETVGLCYDDGGWSLPSAAAHTELGPDPTCSPPGCNPTDGYRANTAFGFEGPPRLLQHQTSGEKKTASGINALMQSTGNKNIAISLGAGSNLLEARAPGAGAHRTARPRRCAARTMSVWLAALADVDLPVNGRRLDLAISNAQRLRR